MKEHFNDEVNCYLADIKTFQAEIKEKQEKKEETIDYFKEALEIYSQFQGKKY